MLRRRWEASGAAMIVLFAAPGTDSLKRYPMHLNLCGGVYHQLYNGIQCGPGCMQQYGTGSYSKRTKDALIHVRSYEKLVRYPFQLQDRPSAPDLALFHPKGCGLLSPGPAFLAGFGEAIGLPQIRQLIDFRSRVVPVILWLRIAVIPRAHLQEGRLFPLLVRKLRPHSIACIRTGSRKSPKSIESLLVPRDSLRYTRPARIVLGNVVFLKPTVLLELDAASGEDLLADVTRDKYGMVNLHINSTTIALAVPLAAWRSISLTGRSSAW